MKNIPASLFDLIERHSFDELSAEQQQFVLQWMTEEEYHLHQIIASESETAQYDIPEVAPLRIPANVPFWRKPIPLWQAASGIAAALLLFLFLPRNIEQMKSEPTEIVSIVYDTIFKPADTVFMFTTKRITDTVFVPTTIAQETSPRMLEAPNNMYIPWKDASSNTSSVSLKDEKIKITLPETVRVQL